MGDYRRKEHNALSKVRKATKEDSLDFAVLAKQFLRESKYPFSVDMEKLMESFTAACDNESFCVFLLEEEGDIVGMLVGGLSSPLFSSDIVATELAWFVERQHRDGRGSLKLFNEYEKWAKEAGSKFITMVDIDTLQSLGSLYSRKGYTLTEKTYVKEI